VTDLFVVSMAKQPSRADKETRIKVLPEERSPDRFRDGDARCLGQFHNVLDRAKMRCYTIRVGPVHPVLKHELALHMNEAALRQIFEYGVLPLG
jgi:hypothetical protein